MTKKLQLANESLLHVGWLLFRFVRSEEDDTSDSWEVRMARRYYAKLFKEYAIADLSRYKVCTFICIAKLGRNFSLRLYLAPHLVIVMALKVCLPERQRVSSQAS